MSEDRIADLVRHYFDSWENADRPALEALLADDFTFTSPWDDHISKARFFEHCFPHAGTFGFKRPISVMTEGEDAFIRYETILKSGGGFRNMEYFRVEGGRIRSIEVFFGFVPGAGEGDAPAAQTEIKALIAERVEAMRTKDAARAIATLADDVVAFELAPPLRLGPGQARDQGGLEAWFDGWQGEVDVEVARLTVAAAGDVGYAHSLNRMRGTKTDGKEVDFWMRSTLGLRKTGDGWRIAHGHTSVPFHMDGSFRAALDLEP
jgi:ketosteroid isomerase-like protein